MKANVLLISVFLIIFAGCDTAVRDRVYMYYDETQCSDKWGSGYTPENEKKQNIISYFDNSGIRIYDLQIINDGIAQECKACYCTTGNRIRCEVKKDDISKMKKERFYE